MIPSTYTGGTATLIRIVCDPAEANVCWKTTCRGPVKLYRGTDYPAHADGAFVLDPDGHNVEVVNHNR